MRWRYIDPKNKAEAAERAATVAAIDAWWKAFRERAPEISRVFSRTGEMDIPGFMDEHLKVISPELMWEFGPGPGGAGHSLVITPELSKHLRPLVDVILERAPKMEGWAFYGYRMPSPVEWGIQAVLGRTGHDLTGAGFEARMGEAGSINLTYHLPATFKGTADEANGVAFVATEAILGEEILNTWIGEMKGQPPAGLIGKLLRKIKPVNSKPLEQLAGTVEALIEAIKEQLPKEPMYLCNRVDGPELRDGTYSLIKLQGPTEPASDYPGISDMYVAMLEDLDLWKLMHLGGYPGVCKTRSGETFCYLKLDGTQVGEDPVSRSAMEDALNQALIPAGKGCTIGGGTGARYSYIDLALVDFDNAWPVVVETMRKQKLGNRCWILFCERELGDEWIGIFDDTPEPPKEKRD
jgi:hypothetical protein